MKTPAAGFRMPAEWEPHEATWIGWPHNASDWPAKFPAISWVYGEIVRRVAPGEIVRILVNSKAHEARARRVLGRAGVDLERVEMFRLATDRGWTRDFGPLFVKRDVAGSAEVAIVRFGFNGWAKYADWRKDAKISERVARRLRLRLFEARLGPTAHSGSLPGNSRGPSPRNGSSRGDREGHTARNRSMRADHGRERLVVLEGGSIDVNGRGTLITTEECLLDQQVQVRNPGLSRADLEAVFRDYLGVTNVLWLGRGIAGDDTHGHIDDVCRFVGPRTVVLCRETDPNDENYRALEENREQLEGMRVEDGSGIEVVDLPMPEPLYFAGRRLPASYANFYIANAAVLVPTFNDPHDRVALGILAELFPDRAVVGIHAVDLVWGLGTLHCMTQQQPA